MTFSESKSKELTEILNQLKSKIDGLQTKQKMEIQSDIVIIENELSSQRQDKTRVEHALGSLYNKIKDMTPLLGIAIQIANWFKPA
jgi:chromosome segregation ATPase